jgi:hypothetical protein
MPITILRSGELAFEQMRIDQFLNCRAGHSDESTQTAIESLSRRGVPIRLTAGASLQDNFGARRVSGRQADIGKTTLLIRYGHSESIEAKPDAIEAAPYSAIRLHAS